MKRPATAQLALGAAAIFAFLWVIARACIQSITIDEADTYLVWVARPDPSHWSPASNNHILNSLLMRLFTGLFGLSHLAVRAPALIGAAIYIAAAYYLCHRIVPDLRVALPMLVCLIYNPLVMDHLVAARGYSLALAFLMVMLAIAARARIGRRECAICSACAALSFAANFAFALVDSAALAGIFLLACRASKDRLRIAWACIAPGLAVSIFLTSHALLHFPKQELWYGAHSLGEMLRTVRESSLYRLNPQIVNPTLLQTLRLLAPWLVPAALALAAWQFRRRQPAFAYLLVGVLAAAICGHWLMFRAFHVLLPKDRTAIWIVPLVTVAAGLAAINQRALAAMLGVLSIYFVLCLRLHYFKEWDWDADMQDIYGVLAWYNHTSGVPDIASNWQYGSALNFYRLRSGRESIPEIPSPIDLQAGHAMYVLNYPFDEEFLKKQRLRVVYHARNTDAVVAASGEVGTALN